MGFFGLGGFGGLGVLECRALRFWGLGVWGVGGLGCADVPRTPPRFRVVYGFICVFRRVLSPKFYILIPEV